MGKGSLIIFTIESVREKDFNEVRSHLKEYLINMGLDFGWKLVNDSNTLIKFETKSFLKTSLTFGHQEEISIDISTRDLKVDSKVSFDNTWRVPFVDKTTKWNDVNLHRVLNELPKVISNYLDSDFEINRRNEQRERRKQISENENIRVSNLKSKQNQIIYELDTDRNGEIDLIDSELFSKLLDRNQKCIIDIDKNYIQKFVKVSSYLKTKKSNTQKIFESIKDTKNENELHELVSLLKNQIHTYELLILHSISMVTSIIENELITFYEIYECFDQLGVFNSNWENEVSNKLTDIGTGIKDLMYSIYQMENKIVNSIDSLSYITKDSFNDLQISISRELQNIDSGIQVNNLFTGIQTYQMYKINQNTKRIG